MPYAAVVAAQCLGSSLILKAQDKGTAYLVLGGYTLLQIKITT